MGRPRSEPQGDIAVLHAQELGALSVVTKGWGRRKYGQVFVKNTILGPSQRTFAEAEWR